MIPICIPLYFLEITNLLTQCAEIVIRNEEISNFIWPSLFSTSWLKCDSYLFVILFTFSPLLYNFNEERINVK